MRGPALAALLALVLAGAACGKYGRPERTVAPAPAPAPTPAPAETPPEDEKEP